MNLHYRIEVSLEPNYHDCANKPYFWRIASLNIDNPNSQYCTTTAGWAETPEKAFEEAKMFYDKYIKGE